jgi:RNA polymerase sigma-70 factor (ECF subfamily)
VKSLEKRLKKKDPKAFRELVMQYTKPIYNLCMLYLTNDIDAIEATQETFTRFYQGLDQFDPQRPLRPWLFKIARNICLNMLSKRKKEPLVEEIPQELCGEKNSSKEIILLSEDLATLRDSLKKLPQPYRDILIHKFYEGLPNYEVARLCGIKRENFRVYLFRALQLLRRFVNESHKF